MHDLGLVMHKYTTSITAGMKDGNFCPPTAATKESPISLHRNTRTLASPWNYDFQEIKCTAIVRQEPIESKVTTPAAEARLKRKPLEEMNLSSTVLNGMNF
jgi:hypothetical protein